MEENVTEQGFASAWNNNQGVLKEVMELRSAANASFIKGDLDNAFKCLESIYQTVSAILGESEISNLKDIQEKIDKNNLSKAINQPLGFEHINKYFARALSNDKKLYREYSEILTKALQGHELLITKKTDSIGVH